MVGGHHRLDGRELAQALGAGDGQGGLERCGSWGHKELDTTERLKNSRTGSPRVLPFLLSSMCVSFFLEYTKFKLFSHQTVLCF